MNVETNLVNPETVTVKQCAAIKHNLEAEILSLLRAFEDHTGLLVSTIELRHFENVSQGKFCVSGVTIETKIT